MRRRRKSPYPPRIGPMLIDCPGCGKSYHISRASLGLHGKNVACPHCLTRWFTAADAQGIEDRDADDRFAIPEITAEAISERTHQPTYEELYGEFATPQAQMPIVSRQRYRWPRTAIMIASVVGLMMSVIGFRGAIVKAWPQAGIVYAAAGFPVNARGLDLQNVHVNLVQDGAQPLLVVDGEIANLRSEKAQVPELRLAVRDAQGHEIYIWDAASPKAKLEGGETVAFRARLAAPPAEAHDLFVRFAAAAPQSAR